eukprot:scaffold277613_cov31-Tisochrysis_lutea.AAC.4
MPSSLTSQVKPELILGLSGKKGTISEEAIRKMASHVKAPIVMPLSNPTSATELTPEEAYLWSEGRAIVATGSPFDPVTLPNGATRYPSQCNNMYIFPGIGLGASVRTCPPPAPRACCAPALARPSLGDLADAAPAHRLYLRRAHFLIRHGASRFPSSASWLIGVLG